MGCPLPPSFFDDFRIFFNFFFRGLFLLLDPVVAEKEAPEDPPPPPPPRKEGVAVKDADEAVDQVLPVVAVALDPPLPL